MSYWTSTVPKRTVQKNNILLRNKHIYFYQAIKVGMWINLVSKWARFGFYYWLISFSTPTPVFLPGESQGWGSLCGLPSMGSHRVGHDWSDLAAAAALVHHRLQILPVVNWQFTLCLSARNRVLENFSQNSCAIPFSAHLVYLCHRQGISLCSCPRLLQPVIWCKANGGNRLLFLQFQS